METSSDTLGSELNHKYIPARSIGGYSEKIDDNTDIVIYGKWQPNKPFEYKYSEAPLSAFDVASYILKQLGELTTMKLHKLLYYCQAWSLVWDERPLFNDDIEAWANGPVVSRLFAFHRGQYSLTSLPLGNPDLLNIRQKDTVNAVLKFYGHKSAQWLIELTHMESPWNNARIGLAPMERGNKVISLESMAEYYSALK